MISSPVDEIKNRLDAVEVIQGYIRLQKAGRNWRALCPFHSEKTPSFFVSPERQMWYCFGCQKGGSIFDFVMQMEGIEFGDALKILAQRAGVELKKIDPKFNTERTRLYELCELAARFFERQLEAGKTGQLALKYLKERGLKLKTIEEWRLGYAPDKWQALSDFLRGRGYSQEEISRAGLVVKKDEIRDTKYQIQDTNYYDRFRNRIIFPIFDLNGIVVGFSGRIFGQGGPARNASPARLTRVSVSGGPSDAGGPARNASPSDAGGPKYLNTSNTLIYDKSRVLYGLDRAKIDVRKNNLCVLVEGQMDVLMSYQAGLRNVVASSGTALTEEHLRIIKRYTENLATAFDMDLAGETATKRSIDLAVAFGFNTKIIQVPSGKDPADCLKNNPSLWLEAVGKAQSVMDFYFSAAFSNLNPSLAEDKKEIAKIILPVLKKMPNKIEQAHWISELGRRLKTDEKILAEEMKNLKIDARAGFHKTNKVLAGEDSPAITEKSSPVRLEEYLFSLLLTYPHLIDDFRNQPSYLFDNLDLAGAFKIIKKFKTPDSENFKKALPADLTGRIDFLVFKKEIEPLSENFDPKKEIEFCFSQLRDRFFRQKLAQLNLAIKEAEEKRDKVALKNLTEEFNKISQQMIR